MRDIPPAKFIFKQYLKTIRSFMDRIIKLFCHEKTPLSLLSESISIKLYGIGNRLDN